jgi:hypothetical protein
MATYKVLYWQEVPSQVRAEDDDGDVSLPLAPRFTELIDRLAMQRGLSACDDFLAEWHWGDEQAREGSAQEVAAAVKTELETQTYG